MSLTRHNDESGLTTLEWLLIVAAVAGLAALAVVLVQNVVNDTAEQIAGSSARQTAATVAAQEITDESIARLQDRPKQAREWAGWQDYFTKKCAKLEIIYGDVVSSVEPHFRVIDPTHQRTYVPRASDKITDRGIRPDGIPAAFATVNGKKFYVLNAFVPYMDTADYPTDEPPTSLPGRAIAHCQVVL